MTQPTGSESSVLFSLQELMGLEEARVRTEERERAETLQAEQDARRRLEAERRAAEEARLAAEDEKRREEARRAREEDVRLAAIRAAEIERQRIEAERRAQIEAMAQQQRHEQELLRITQDASARRLRRITTAVALSGLLVVTGGLGTYFGKIAPETRAREQADRERLAAEQDAAARAKGEAAEARANVERLMHERDLAKTAEERARKEIELTRAREAEKKLPQANVGTGTVPVKTTPKEAQGPCAKGDSMCGLER